MALEIVEAYKTCHYPLSFAFSHTIFFYNTIKMMKTNGSKANSNSDFSTLRSFYEPVPITFWLL